MPDILRTTVNAVNSPYINVPNVTRRIEECAQKTLCDISKKTACGLPITALENKLRRLYLLSQTLYEGMSEERLLEVDCALRKIC